MLSRFAGIPYWRLSSFYFYYFALLGAWLPFWPLYLQHKNFTAEDIGYLTSVMMATRIIAPNFWGWLADYSGQRIRIIRIGSLLALCSFICLFIVEQGFWQLAVVIALFSFFWNAVLAQFEVVTLSYLGELFNRYSQIRVWGSIGFIVMVACLGLFFDYFSITWLPWIVVLILAGIWLSSLTIKHRAVVNKASQSKLSFIKVLKQPAVAVFLINSFLMQVSHGPYYTFFSVYLEEQGYSRTVTGLLWSLGVLAEVLIFMVMHKLLRRFSLHQIMIYSLLLSVIRWLIIAFYVESWPLLIFAQCLHAASFGTFHAYSVEMVRRLFKGGFEGQGMALTSSLSFGVGGAVGALCSGLLWSISAQVTFLMAALSCFIAMLIGLLVGNHKV